MEKYLYYSTGSVKSINPEWVAEQLLLEGYTMLSTYKSINRPFKFICPNGHRNSISLNNWNRGRRCFQCSKNYKYRNDGASSFFAKYGYTIIGGEYKNNRSPITYTCEQGHTNTVTLSALKFSNTTCPFCKGTRTTIEEIETYLLNRGCKLISPKKNFKHDIPVKYENANGEIKTKYWNNIKRMKNL
ncbi:hypothetical protein ELBI_33 [Anabaena phage Elbi]|nr:hypothetical protein ELBI_33 [Anabaena phage Elbi]